MELSVNPGRERRKNPRTTLTKILYVNLESGNGGIVLNVSDGGLAFHSVAPLTHNGPVRLWFSLSNDHRFEVSGELVWSNQTKKTGGVRFTNLTDSDRAQIRSLAGEVASLGARSTAHPPALNARHELASLEEGAVIVPTAPTPQIPLVKIQQSAIQDRPPHHPAGADAFSHSILNAEEPPHRRQLPTQEAKPPQPRPPQPPLEATPPELAARELTTPQVGLEDRLPHSDAYKNGYGQYGYARANKSWAAPPPLESSGPSLGRVFIMLIGALILAAAGVLLYSHSGEVGSALVRLGQRLQGRSSGASQAASQVPQQAAASSSASGPATSPQVTPQPDAEAALPAEQPQAQSSAVAPTPGGTEALTPSGTTKDSQVADLAGNTASENVPASSASDVKAVRSPHTSRVFRHAAPPIPAEKALSPSQRQAIAQADDSDSAADLDIAERYLNGIGRTRNSAAAAQFLWAAVAKGNATAELTLAHLYLNGDGVGRSCEQARLLLQAAASKGDVEANETLANLSRERCR